MEWLHTLSILLEAVVAVLGVMIATSKKKTYGWGIALTFALYVVYDLANFLKLNTPGLYAIFFIATASILWTVWQLYKDT